MNCVLLNGLVRKFFGGIFRFMYCFVVVYGFVGGGCYGLS